MSDGKRPAIGLQIKLACATMDEVKARHGEELRQSQFFIRTKSPRPKDTVVRLEAQLSDGSPAFRAAGIVIDVEGGMRLQLVGADDAGRELVTALGGKPPAHLKTPRKKIDAVFVYDLNGARFEGSVIIEGNVVDTRSDAGLGGAAFDAIVADHLRRAYRDARGADFAGGGVTEAAERARLELSEHLETTVKIGDVEIRLSRSELVLLTGHLVDQTLKICKELLAAHGLDPADIAEVRLAGGQARMPFVLERVRNFFGREPVVAAAAERRSFLGWLKKLVRAG
jgi:hypothetical protein